MEKLIKKFFLFLLVPLVTSSTNEAEDYFNLKSYEVIKYDSSSEAKPIYYLNPIDYVTNAATISNNFKYYPRNSYLDLINYLNQNVSSKDKLDVHILNDFLDEVSNIYTNFYPNKGLIFDVNKSNQTNKVYVDGINNKFGYYLFCIYSSDFISYKFEIEYKVNSNTFNFNLDFKELNTSFIQVNYFEKEEEVEDFIEVNEVKIW